ncbi:MAG TPA: hypothetical protein VHL11_11080 [Phototrophicaceae bacterium]|jgi:hypothetical protein|nr:hypothetical protein [Phototrophicaceae bacterium]
MDDPQSYFRTLLLTVVSQAFTAAGYLLEENPMQQAGGLYRFQKSLEDGKTATIEFQHLVYHDSEWSSGVPSRFRINLSRSDGLRRDLSALVVEDFGVAILPSGKHWWMYRDTNSLGQALAEAGRLVIGYGMPWLAGDLHPDAS